MNKKKEFLKILILFSTKSVPGMISAHITNNIYKLYRTSYTDSILNKCEKEEIKEQQVMNDTFIFHWCIHGNK